MIIDLPTLIYFFAYVYACYIGIGFIFIAITIAFFNRKRLIKVATTICLITALIGSYFILWNFRIINYPYRSPNETNQGKSQLIEENQNNAKLVNYKTFDLSYKPDYVKSWSPIYSVYLFTENSTEIPYLEIVYEKYIKGTSINSECLTISEFKPVVDIHQESSLNGSCTSAYKLSDYIVIGHNDSGGEILRAFDGVEIVYLTDHMGTRIKIQNSSTTILKDSDVIKMLHNLVPFDIKKANFKDPRV